MRNYIEAKILRNNVKDSLPEKGKEKGVKRKKKKNIPNIFRLSSLKYGSVLNLIV